MCHGLNNDDQKLLNYYYKCQNPQDTQRTGNAGLQIKLGKDALPLNVAVYKKFCKASPYFLFRDNKGDLFVKDIRDGSLVIVHCPDKAPFWYNYPLYHNKEKSFIGDFILLEGDFTAILSITKGCTYFNHKNPCAFCAISEDATPEEAAIRKCMIYNALPYVASDKNILNFHLTGGNTFSDDRGALNYIDYVNVLKGNRNDALIAVEIPPPKQPVQNLIFSKLKKVGVDSIDIIPLK